MNFYVDSGGAILGVEPEKIYQGSANANTIRFVGAFASNVKVTVAFKLPTGVWTTPQLMTASTQLAGVVTSNGVQFNVWEYSIPALVTETFGTVNMQFYVYGDAGNGNGGLIATASSSFQVERGVPITLPDPTDDYETLLTQILSALSQIEGQIPGMEEDITGLQSKVSDISDKVSTLSDVTTELMSDVDNLSIQVSDLSEDKLDKQSGATAYEEAYVKDTDGSQKMERVTITSIASAIVKRDANGNINIAKGLSGNPKNGANMENIADVEEKISKCPTLAGNNDFTGENTFEEAIQAKKGTVVKNSLDETNYNAGYISRNDWTYLFPADSGTFALTKNIPTDYATQTALANTQRQVDGLYTLLEQKNEIYVQTATDTYTTRETAGGENIADGVQTPVKRITGKTVKTTNLFGLTAEDFKNGTIDGEGEKVTLKLKPNTQYTLSSNTPLYMDNATSIWFNGVSTSPDGVWINQPRTTTTDEKGELFISIRITEIDIIFENYWIMLNEGSTALPYMPYFSGLKNAFFKEIVSTGRNLFSAETAIPYNNCTYENGVVKQISADSADYYTWKIQFFKDSTFLTQSDVIFPQTGTIPALTIEKPSEANRLFLGLNGRERDTLMMIDVSNFPNGKYTATWNVLNITQGSVSWNNIMLNYGSSALPYEPYTQSVLSLPEAVELTEYDTAYPETGEIQRQSNTLTFNGTETWYTSIINDYYAYYVITKPVGFSRNGLISNKITTRAYNAISGQNEGCYMSNADFNAIVFWFLQTAYPNLSTSTAWKAQLAAWNEAGNPLTVTYKTAEITTEQADFSADSYIAWKNGSETIEQGDTDNSEYGAENTVEQDYYLLTAPEEVTKE